MKRSPYRFSFPLLLALLLPAAAAANPNATGLGLVLGEPTGFEVRHRLSRTNAIHGTLAYSFSDYFLLSGDYVYEFHQPTFLPAEMRATLTPYLGLGGALIFATGTNAGSHYFGAGNSFGMGIRVPLGLEWNPHAQPFGVFAELAPGLGIIPGTYGFLQGGIGAVYYFR